MSANEYARARGRAASLLADIDAKANPPARSARPISAAAQQRALENRAAVHEHMPEMLPVIKELHELGMIDGWRNVEEVTVFHVEQPGQPE